MNTKNIVIIIFSVLLSFVVNAKDYGGFNPEGFRTLKTQPITTAKPGETKKQKVQEFFWYGCPHCSNFMPYLHEWEKTKSDDTELDIIPVIFRPNFENHARAFYAAKQLNSLDKFHEPFFELWNKKNIKLYDKNKIADFAAEQGIDRDKFLDAMFSFNTETQIRKAKFLQKKYQIDGVPTVVINEKFVTSATEAGGTHEGVIEVIKKLLDNTRQKK
ncbi:MAG: thiol:disulfide interchange protein DsbA/DsbL [Gammaproteobacteria bacterium]|nr:MAG: thiol:disulfide interchange protein DsbA/DsbL [Gammaproteobacteria bacterium]